MKFIITESKIDNIILNFLNMEFIPDYDWGPELFDFYKNEVDKYGSVDFYVNDEVVFTYFGEWDGYDYLYRLEVYNHVSEILDNVFGSRWVPVLKNWFEKNTNLEVKEMRVYGEIIYF